MTSVEMSESRAVSKLAVVKCLGPRLALFFKTCALLYVIFPNHEPSIPYCLFKCAPIISLIGFILIYGLRVSHKKLYAQKILLGLVFSSIGDICLVWHTLYAKLGMFFFGIAHILYISAFGFRPRAYLLGCIVMSIFSAAVIKCIPGLEGYSGLVVAAYGLVLALMVWRANAQLFSHESPIPWTSLSRALGGCLFGFSDCVLGFVLFRNYHDWLSVLVLPTYYAAQLCITVSVLDRQLNSLKAGSQPT